MFDLDKEDNVGFGWSLVFIMFVLLALLGSCKSVEYVPVESVRTDSIVITKHRTDSVYVRDSIATIIKGDTVTIDRTKYVYKYLSYRDTCYVERTDSIRVPYPVEKPLTRWQRMKIELEGWAFGNIILMAIIIVGWMVYRRRLRR